MEIKDKLENLLLEMSERNIQEKDLIDKLIDNLNDQYRLKEIRCVRYVNTNHAYFYGVTNDGRFFIVKKEVIDFKEKNNGIVILENLIFKGKSQNIWQIKLYNGKFYQTDDLPCKINTSKDAYAFVTEAYAKELEEKNEELLKNLEKNYPEENISLELHHINNNVNNNGLDNLIYIPKFIHNRLNKE